MTMEGNVANKGLSVELPPPPPPPPPPSSSLSSSSQEEEGLQEQEKSNPKETEEGQGQEEPTAPRTPTKRKQKRGSRDEESFQNSETKEEEDIDSKEDLMQFVPPDKGTPAAQALQANADIKVSRFEKGFRRIKGIKHPKAKNITKFMKKKKDKKRAFGRNFKGKVIDGVHELYTITAGMMLGLRCAVGRSSVTSTQNLSLGDFSYVEKISFPPGGNTQPPFRTPPHQLAHTFKFKTYAPLVFSRLRDFFGVDSMSYMMSVCGNYNYLEFISNSKSGQFFFYSHDGRFMIKTQTNEENKFMKRILPHYYRYVTENPHTFLVRIYGMHRVKMYHLHRKTHFVIMQSVFDTPEPIQTIYDLKGSLVGRRASAKERDGGGVLKDQDLIDDGVKLQLGVKREAVLEQLEKDANFLAALNIMDYSLLLGVHNRRTRRPSDGEAPPPRLGSTKQKSRSILPFRLKDDSGNALGDAINHLESHNEPHQGITKKRSSSFSNDRTPKSAPIHTMSRTASADRNDPRASSEVEVHGASSNEYSDVEEYDDYDDELTMLEDDDDAGDSDVSDALSSCDVEVPAANLKDEASVLLNERDSDGGPSANVVNHKAFEEKPSVAPSPYAGSALTGHNLTAVSNHSGAGTGDMSSIHSSSMYATVGSTTVGSHTETSAYNSGEEEDEAGVGLAGEEGKAVSKMFRDSVNLSEVASAGDRLAMRTPLTSFTDATTPTRTVTFGPGATYEHPWTGRHDGGINSRLPNGKRGEEIYYMGVIDILQQYNSSKRLETFFKGLTNDKTQISSVDSVSYAKRFVEFMRKNTV